jgi:tetraacyldisaccharide 4'-kinase
MVRDNAVFDSRPRGPRHSTLKAFWHNLYRRLEEREEIHSSGAFLHVAAAVIAAVYGLGARARRAAYTEGWLKARRLPAPVVSVGNLTVGGTGKTPMTACLARMFQEQGRRVAILSRGYGGSRKSPTRLSDGDAIYFKPPEVGEEAYWLARNLPGAAVYTGACRFRAGTAAWQEFRPDLFLLDDGFQHFQLHRDRDIVLLDAAAPFGNGCLLPRGPLREPISTGARAQVLILTRFDSRRHQESLARIRDTFPDKVVLTAAIRPARARRYPGGEPAPPEALEGLPLFAFAGLARPQVFLETLQALKADVKGTRWFPDHYPLESGHLARLAAEARTRGARFLVTTEKDWARLEGVLWPDFPLWVLGVEAEFHEPEAALKAIFPEAAGER